MYKKGEEGHNAETVNSYVSFQAVLRGNNTRTITKVDAAWIKSTEIVVRNVPGCTRVDIKRNREM